MNDKNIATIYHNPRCTKSGLTLQLLKDQGITPNVVFYLETPPNNDELNNILSMLNVDIRSIMRKNEPEYLNNKLDDETIDDTQLIQSIINNPIILERPIVTYNGKAAIGRPPENILDIL